MTYFEKLAELSANGIDWSEIPRAVLYGTFSAFESGYQNVSYPIQKLPESVSNSLENTQNLLKTAVNLPKTVDFSGISGLILLGFFAYLVLKRK